MGLVGFNAYSGEEDLQSPNACSLCHKQKLIHLIKEMCLFCVFNFAPLIISFKDVQKCADFIKVEVGDIYQAHGSLGQQVTRKEKGKKKKKESSLKKSLR